MRRRPQAAMLVAAVLSVMSLMLVSVASEVKSVRLRPGEKTSSGPAKGSLVVVGGQITPEIRQRFVALACRGEPLSVGERWLDHARI